LVVGRHGEVDLSECPEFFIAGSTTPQDGGLEVLISLVVEAEVFTVPLLVVLADQEAAVLTEVLVVLALAVKGLLGVRVFLLVLLQLLAEAVGALVL
jgi:hypothetical protein